jgi:hypothetical protein
MKIVESLFVGGLLVAAAAASAQPSQAEFEAAAGRYGACMVATVRMGMTTKMDPAAFKAGLDKSCKGEEAAFRAAALKQAMALGRSQPEAEQEIEGNIARGKAVWASDQATYVRTGRVPR